VISGARKRTSSETIHSGEDDSDSDDESESSSLVKKTTRAMRDTLYYITDMDKFQPPKKKPK